MRIAYFTAGNLGAGHLSRAHAIRRALARRGFDGQFTAFGPTAPFEAAARELDYRALKIDAAEVCDPRRAPSSELHRAIVAFEPDLLLVDVFWAPLRHLPRACETWLLLRRVPAKWLEGPPMVRFDPSIYDAIVAIEPLDLPLPRLEQIAPVVICNPDECRPQNALREWLGAGDGELAVVAHAGQAGEIDELVRAAGDRRLHRLDLAAQRTLYPMAEWLGGADALFLGGGYNTFWEARWLGYDRRARFVPFARRNDDQAWRIGCDLQPRENGADTLARRILNLRDRRPAAASRRAGPAS